MKRFQFVTLWYRYDDKLGKWVFNHLEYGWSLLKRPIPMSRNQLVWNEMTWTKDHSVMDQISRAVA